MPNEDEFSYFQTGTGLPLDGAQVTVVDGGFIIDNSYAAGAVVAQLTMQPFDGSDAQSQLYSTGKNFEIRDHGATLQHSSGKLIKINSMSTYGQWIDACLKMEGATDFLNEARARQMEPNSIALWFGMMFELGAQPYTDMSGKEKSLIVPIKYFGVNGEMATDTAPTQGVTPSTPSPAPAAAKKAAGPQAAATPRPGPVPGPTAAPTPRAAPSPATPASPGRTMPPRPGTPAPGVTTAPPAPTPPTPPAAQEAEFSGEIDGVDQGWTDWAIALAAVYQDHGDFMAAAMETDGVAGQKALEQAIMSSRPGSLWATHHG